MSGDHVEETARAITQLLLQHDEAATVPEKLVERLLGYIGGPGFMFGLAVAIGFWGGVNWLGPRFGLVAFDPPPFAGLQTLLAMMALFIALIILTTQRRDDRLSRHRSHQILRLSMLAEQKIAKAIELLEEARRDNPLIRNRLDTEALAMAQPADPGEVLHPPGTPDGSAALLQSDNQAGPEETKNDPG